MLQPRWTYSNGRRLTQWYGHVDYYGPYVIGQWFALDAESGEEFWSGRFRRPTTVFGMAQDVIVASETRSDGPWTIDYGIYGIDVKSGALRWTNHGRGFWNTICRLLDHVPGFTNEIRDAPKSMAGDYLVTRKERILDIRSGRQRFGVPFEVEPDARGRAERFYDDKSISVQNDDVLVVEGLRDDFALFRLDASGRQRWEFRAKDLESFVRADYYSYRLVGGNVLLILGDAPDCVPIDPSKPFLVKPNPANFQLGIVDIENGECRAFPLDHSTQRVGCRIEAIHGSRLLISCDDIFLTEYETCEVSDY